MVGADLISPLEFWSLSPGQVWWLVRAKRKSKDAGKPQQNAELYTMLKEAKARETVNG